jgi:primary-amine oxidase
VNPCRPEERDAAGGYPTQIEPGMGQPAWTAANGPSRDTGIVRGHSIGVRHVVRAEDCPVMPVACHSFELRPFDFFNLDLPPR